MAAKKETYSQAMERLEKIVRQIDNNELDIDILSEKIKEANEIIAFCTCFCNIGSQIFGGDAESVGFSRCIDICQDHNICFG